MFDFPNFCGGSESYPRISGRDSNSAGWQPEFEALAKELRYLAISAAALKARFSAFIAMTGANPNLNGSALFPKYN